MTAATVRIGTSGFHGQNYGGSYSHQLLTATARWIAARLKGELDGFAYFNNDAEGHAVANARDLKRHLQNAMP